MKKSPGKKLEDLAFRIDWNNPAGTLLKLWKAMQTFKDTGMTITITNPMTPWASKHLARVQVSPGKKERRKLPGKKLSGFSREGNQPPPLYLI